jgi:hypothetical protein
MDFDFSSDILCPAELLGVSIIIVTAIVVNGNNDDLL